MVVEFKNQTLTDFSKRENKQAMEKAINLVTKKELGKEYPLIIGEEKIFTDEKIISTNPALPEEVVGKVSVVNEELLDRAIAKARDAFNHWQYTSAKERAGYLLKAAAVLKKRRLEFAAWMVVEVGKNWIEADADVAEAIDFLEFYGREMLRYSLPQPVTFIPGEITELFYIPLGVGAIISPWNFPMAIMVGMSSAAVVTGNTIILKPASISSVIAAKFMEVWEEVMLPAGVVNFCPGAGGKIGDYLVSHPQIRFISFTGSKEVGLRINELAAKPSAGQKWIKRVIAEMGGKDTIIVDDTAELDKAIEGIVTSAFGYQGQKCSACSRVVATSKIYSSLVEGVIAETEKLTVGNPRKFTNYLGPVSSKSAYEKIMSYIEIGKQEGKLAFGGKGRTDLGGWFIEPTIFVDVPPTARISQEEIFGPVVAFIKAQDFEEALNIANNTEYGLTGALYSRNRKNLELARERFFVGNLYFNRKCTGALVGVHPFGGFNMSGTDSKAGGRDYLLLFLQAKSVSEKL